MIAWSVHALAASALLIALVMPLRGPVARLFGARAAYALWALPALRFVMPALPGWDGLLVPLWVVRPHHVAIGFTDPANAARLAVEAPLPPVPAPPALDPLPLADTAWHICMAGFALWLAGAALWFAWSLAGYARFLARALRGATLLTRECGVEVWLTGAVDGPVAAGIVRRRIFLPLDFMTRYGPAERRLALLHEGAHHDRRDILANLVALAVLALHWWNPLAHRAYRLFRADQELACDETVLADLAHHERHAYGSAVVKAAAARMPGVACALGHRAELKQRLRAMARPVARGTRARLGLGLAAAAVAGGLVLTAPGRGVARVIPAAPVAPLAPEAPAAPVVPEAPTAPAPLAAPARPAPPAPAAAIRRPIAESPRAADEARREADQARAEALREAARARAEADEARVEGLREAAQARAEASRMRAEALREAGRARAEAYRARYAGARGVDAVRRSMAAECAAQGKPVSPDLDWSRLALCGDSGAAMAARIRADVRRELARAGD